MKFFSFFLLFLIIFSLPASSLAINIFRSTEVNYFYPNFEYHRTFNVWQTNGSWWQVSMEGNLSQYALVEPDSIQGDGSFDFSLEMPADYEPGRHSLLLCVSGKPDGSGSIALKTSLCSYFRLISLYEGKYLKLDSFDIGKTDVETENIDFSFLVSNWGKQNISYAYVQFDLYDNNEIIKTTTTNTEPVISTQSAQLMGQMPIEGIVAGGYFVKAEVFWDEGSETIERDLIIGSANVQVINVSDNFTTGIINPITITIKSGFKGKVNNVHLTLEPAGQPIVKSESLSLGPFEERDITLYFDARNLEPGEHPAQIITYMENEQIHKKNFVLNLKEEEKQNNLWMVGLVGGAIIGIILAILLTNIFVIKYLIRRKSSKIKTPIQQENYLNDK
ncbi:hypothetical protein ACFLZB_03535 [Nanoarchaeota archaeon]